MKILFIGTTDRKGGAAIASFRLFLALKKRYKDINMLVRNKFSSEKDVQELNDSIFQKTLGVLRFVAERLFYLFYMKSKDLFFFFSPANTGQNIIHIKKVKEADIIHLHWINQGFLSLNDLKKLFRSNKKIIWTMHDMWAFTGGCHYSGDCENYINECGRCPFLRTNNYRDLSYRILKKKETIYRDAKITFVASSRWLAERARKSHLLKNFDICVLPNPIDTEAYKPGDKADIRRSLSLPENKFLILAGSANLKEKRKGFSYLVEALRILKENSPEITEQSGLITFGKSSTVSNMPVQVYPQPYLNSDEKIAKLYQAADVFILPTLEDNLPSMVIESLACGTPVIAFNTGGIPDMLDHKVTGYLGKPKNADEIINGINWVRLHPNLAELKTKCRKKVVDNFSAEIVSEKYMKLYAEIFTY